MVKGEPQLCKFLINPEYQDTDTFVCKGELFVGSVVKKEEGGCTSFIFQNKRDLMNISKLSKLLC